MTFSCFLSHSLHFSNSNSQATAVARVVSGQPRPQGAFPKPRKSALRTRLDSGEASTNLMGGIKVQNTGPLSVVLVEEKFQSLTVNPRNIDAENDDKTLNIDNHDVRKAEQIK